MSVSDRLVISLGKQWAFIFRAQLFKLRIMLCFTFYSRMQSLMAWQNVHMA